MRHLRRVLATCVIGTGLLSTTPDDAQAQRRATSFWVTVGLGPATQGTALLASASLRRAPHLVSLRATASTTFDTFWCGDDDRYEFALLYGRGRRTRLTWGSLASGIGLVTEDRSVATGFFSCTIESTGPTLGLPVEASFAWTPVGAPGIGITAFGNINREASFGGIVASIMIGRLRRPE